MIVDGWVMMIIMLRLGSLLHACVTRRAVCLVYLTTFVFLARTL